jgi:2-haloacid dehalogenase
MRKVSVSSMSSSGEFMADALDRPSIRA